MSVAELKDAICNGFYLKVGNLIASGVSLPTKYSWIYYGISPNSQVSQVLTVVTTLRGCLQQHGLLITRKIATRTMDDVALTHYRPVSGGFYQLFHFCISVGVSLTLIRSKFRANFPYFGDEGFLIIESIEVAEKRQADCRATLIALLGCTGRWRRGLQGQLRDVIRVVGPEIWHTRTLEDWDDKKRIKK